MTLPFYVLDRDVVHAEATLAAAAGADRPAALADLAWHLRERSLSRAAELVAEARSAGPGPAQSARLCLVEALGAAIGGDAELAESALAQAKAIDQAAIGQAASDPSLPGDILLIRAQAEFALGLRRECALSCEAALSAYVGPSMADRRAVAAAQRDMALAYLSATAESLPPMEDPTDEAMRCACQAMSLFTEGRRAHVEGRLTDSVRSYLSCRPLAEGVGMVRLAVIAILNAGIGFSEMKDYASTIELDTEALDLARRIGAPALIHSCQDQIASVLTDTGEPDRAEVMLRGSFDFWSKLPRSRQYLICCGFLGKALAKQGKSDEALPQFDEYLASAKLADAPEIVPEALIDRSHALASLGRIGEAWDDAQDALDRARLLGNHARTADVLARMADLHRRFDLPRHEGETRTDAELRLLNEALAVQEQVAGAIPDAGVLLRLSEMNEAAGRMDAAMDFLRRHVAAKERTFSKAMTERQTAFKIREQTHQAREEAARQRETVSLLERLAQMGHDITADLDMAVVAQTMHRHIGTLLPVQVLALYLLDAEKRELRLVYSIEDGVVASGDTLSLDNPRSLSVRSVVEKREVMMELEPDSVSPSHVPGTKRMLTAIFAPLMVNERILGVLTIQSSRYKAYGERERQMFRTLCGFGAVALANATAYGEARAAERRTAAALDALKRTQDELIQAEKLASLGNLVAGVAHELNTPAGISITAASQLATEIGEVKTLLAEGKLAKSRFSGHLDLSAQLAETVLSSSFRVADLVASFKRIAGDGGVDVIQRFDLATLLGQVATVLGPLLRPGGHRLALDCPADLEIESHPGAIAQILTNLVENSVKHGFGERPAGGITIRVEPATDGWVRFHYADDGDGMTEAVAARVFEPFFTTRRGIGSSGLGLYMVHNLVTGTLNGRIHMDTSPGGGTRFDILVPLGPEARDSAPVRSRGQPVAVPV